MIRPLELISAAQKIYPDASKTAIVTGSGSDLDAVCSDMAASYSEVWKFDNAELAYPNAEVIRKLLVAAMPQMPSCWFRMIPLVWILAPGLSIKLDSVFVSDTVDFEGFEGDNLKAIRQEYSGQVSTHVTGGHFRRCCYQHSSRCISAG